MLSAARISVDWSRKKFGSPITISSSFVDSIIKWITKQTDRKMDPSTTTLRPLRMRLRHPSRERLSTRPIRPFSTSEEAQLITTVRTQVSSTDRPSRIRSSRPHLPIGLKKKNLEIKTKTTTTTTFTTPSIYSVEETTTTSSPKEDRVVPHLRD